MKSLKHINKYFYKYKWRLLLGISFVGVSNYFAVYSITFIPSAIDSIVKLIKVDSNTIDTQEKLIYNSLMIILFALISGGFLFLMRQTIIVMSRLIEYDLKNEIFEKYQKLNIEFYKKNNTGDLMNRISEDVSRVRMYIGPAIMYILNTFFLFLFTILQMLQVNDKLTFYTLLPLPFLALSIYFVSNLINKKSAEVQNQLSELTSHAQEAFSGIRILKAYGREMFSKSEFERKSNLYRHLAMKLIKVESLFQPFMIFLIGMSTIFTIYIGGILTIRGAISLGEITVFIVFINRLMWPIASLGWVTSLIQRAAASQTRISEFLNQKIEIINSNSQLKGINGDIKFENVSYIYKDTGIKAIKNISFEIKNNSSVAIVGRTGSGKSTIANLLLRLYDADEGVITIGSNDIKLMNLNYLRKQIGYVPQDVFLFSDSITNNIGFGINNNLNQGDEIKKATIDSAIYSNIQDFPEKFETIIGERGITLSGGQKQRISIARAIIKQPKLLIFDDCMSAVDTETEENILRNLSTEMKNKTTLIISHRISTIKNCDNILVLDDGEIIEQGNHSELLHMKGVYSELNKLQKLEAQNKFQVNC